MRIVSWNVNGIRAIIKKEFFESVNLLDPDILCIQEIKAQDSEVEKALLPLKDKQLYINSAEKKGYSGTAILSKSNPISIGYDMGISEHDAEGRVICAEYDNFYLINVYVPNSGQKLERLPYRSKWDADFLRFLKEKEKIKPLIVCGDFNVAHRAIDLKNDKSNYNKTAGYTQIEIDGMDNFINSGFVDSFRNLNLDEVAYTYWSYRFKARERNTGWRIDYFLTSKSLLPKIKSSQILPEFFGSDHCPILLEVDI
ncbi:MAG: exodeoxyribonuclease III [Flavobacteriaceae bacterium]|nr:MAG: exodeoxyribonuclease III [Flavobacteriaceae bacterium]